MDIDVVYIYACTPAHLHHVLTDRAHIEAKMGVDAGRAEVIEATPRRVETTRTVKTSLPGIAAKILGETQTVRQVEEWADPATTAPAVTGTFSGTAPGTPVDVSGTLRIDPDGDGCRLRIHGRVAVKVPIIGGKIASIVHDEVVKNLEREDAFTKTWLAEH